MRKPNLCFISANDGGIIILRHDMPSMFENGYEEGKIYTIHFSPRCSVSGDILPGKIISSAEAV